MKTNFILAPILLMMIASCANDEDASLSLASATDPIAVQPRKVEDAANIQAARLEWMRKPWSSSEGVGAAP